jgi:hypothetical protein
MEPKMIKAILALKTPNRWAIVVALMLAISVIGPSNALPFCSARLNLNRPDDASVSPGQTAAGQQEKQVGMFDAELSTFKTEIDLRVFAASFGYELDRKKSWRGSAVMRNGNGDKIAITRETGGRYLYYSFRNDRDRGTVIDFIQKRRGLTLGAVRKELRQWLGAPATPLPHFEPLVKTAKDRAAVGVAFMKMRVATDHPYLEVERGIPASLLMSERFAGQVHIDACGNAIFAHYDDDGLCGFELRGTDFKGFSTGGAKGLWSSNERPDDTQLVVCEGSIDALRAMYRSAVSPARRNAS